MNQEQKGLPLHSLQYELYLGLYHFLSASGYMAAFIVQRRILGSSECFAIFDDLAMRFNFKNDY